MCVCVCVCVCHTCVCVCVNEDFIHPFKAKPRGSQNDIEEQNQKKSENVTKRFPKWLLEYVRRTSQENDPEVH